MHKNRKIVSKSNWWESPRLWLAMAVVSVVPFVFVEIPPLTDMPNHVARYHIFLNLKNSAFLQQFYSVRWSLVGNLGIDLLVLGLGPWLGAELAARTAVAAIPPLTIAGLYSLSRSLNGRVSPAALAATPLSFNIPLAIGLVNFSLSAAMAMLVLALWIKLRSHSGFFRFPLFVFLSFFTWLAHLVGWGLLALGVFAFELSRSYKIHGLRATTFLQAVLQTLPFAMVLVVTAYWHRQNQAALYIKYSSNIAVEKIVQLASLFRENYPIWDVVSTAIYFSLLFALFVVYKRRLESASVLIFVFYILVFFLFPAWVFQSGWIDRRVLPYAFLVLPLCIGISGTSPLSQSVHRTVSALCLVSVVFFLARMSFTTLAWAKASSASEDRLEILNHIPKQSRLFSLMVASCDRKWAWIGRPVHLQTMALVRRDSMVNGLFQGEGFNQVEVLFRETENFNPNMHALVSDGSCERENYKQTFKQVLADFPRGSFDFLWLMSNRPLPAFDRTGLTPIASVGNDRIYRIEAPN